MIGSADIYSAKILIVDDQDANVRLLDRMLRGAGYSFVASTKNPHEVCEIHRVSRYNLILLDLAMPGMDGFQVMEDLKAIEKDGYLPVLVITAQPEHKLRALKSGARDFISKPFELAEVLTRVYNMIEVRLLHLETKKLYAQVLAEQKVSEKLLLNVLPQSVAGVPIPVAITPDGRRTWRWTCSTRSSTSTSSMASRCSCVSASTVARWWPASSAKSNSSTTSGETP